jgi:hypothetical protein
MEAIIGILLLIVFLLVVLLEVSFHTDATMEEHLKKYHGEDKG